jgi:hypothetical protein
VLLAGLILPQFILIGPSLFGGKILLPLDFLQQPQVYLPMDPAHPPPTLHDRVTTDLVYLFEPHRQFIVSEIRAGRIPLWNPYNYCGVPCLAAGQGAVFSPLRVLDYMWNDPGVLGLDRVLRAIVMGVGAYLFFRRVLGVGFAPAAIGASCYPLTGFMTIWDGYTLPMVALWLPWMLLSIEETLRTPRSAWPIALALTTAAMIFSGHPAMSLHVMLVAFFFAGWRVIAHGDYRWRVLREQWKAPFTLSLAVICGILLACPQILPSAEYLSHSYRVAQRRNGVAEPSSEGPQALLQMVLPYYYGSSLGDSRYVIANNRLESGAAGYAGLIIALILAPLGWLNPRLRSFQIFWLLLALFGVAEIARFPVIGWLLDHPPFSVARGNRLVFASAFAILASGVAGFEELFSDRALRRGWLWVACALLLGLCIVSSYRASDPAAQLEPLRADAQAQFEKDGTWPARKAFVDRALALAVPTFRSNHLTGAIVSGGALILLVLLQLKFLSPRRRGWIIAGAAIVELLVMAWNLNAQCDAQLYYPNLAVFDALRSAPPARAMLVGGFPADLNLTQRLYDIRGFDGADPNDYDEVLQHITVQNGSSPLYAPTQAMVPISCPLFDSLGVRYIMFRGRPPAEAHAIWANDDYWILESPRAAPRAFVPRSVRTVNDPKAQLAELLRPDFDPSRAFIESAKGFEMNNCEGAVRIAAENPQQVDLVADMKTDGVVLLSDRWDPGWRAKVNGKSVEVYRANRLFRAVSVPAGTSNVEFDYSPLSFRIGCWCAALAGGAIVLWGLQLRRRARARSSDSV